MPLWQWTIVFIIIALVIYGVFYYVFLPRQTVYNIIPSSTPTAPAQSVSPVPTTTLITKNDPVKGNFLADSNGMTLYIFDKDTTGVSNCTGGCLAIWTPFLTSLSAQDALSNNLTIIKRDDGTSQYAWKGKPLYFYVKDINPGDILGDGVNGIWHLIKP